MPLNCSYTLLSVAHSANQCCSNFQITRENNNWLIKCPLLAREGNVAVLHSCTSFLLTPIRLALPGYNSGHSQLAFHQREYLAQRPVRFIFARVKRTTLRAGVHPTFAGTELPSLALCESYLNLCSGTEIKSQHICRHVKQALPKTIKCLLFFSYPVFMTEAWWWVYRGIPFMLIWD